MTRCHFVFGGLLAALLAGTSHAKNNIDDVRANIKQGWNDVIWGPHVDHAGQALMVAQMAAAPGSQVAWVLDMVSEAGTIAGSREVIVQVIRQRKRITHDNKVWDAGIATYNHWTEEKVPTLTPPNYKWIKVSRPNTFQPYIRYRTRNPSSGDPKQTPPVRIDYTIWNDTPKTVEFRLPTGRSYALKPDERKKYWNSDQPGKLTMQILGKSKLYRLKSGDHKFWWNKKENRVEFDLNYKK